jgi:integrase
MRKQNGCIREERGRWCLRWRETVPLTEDEIRRKVAKNGSDLKAALAKKGEPVRVMKFRVLGEVTAEHRRSRDRKTGKLRVPDEITNEAQKFLEPLNLASGPVATVTMTIGELVKHYFDKIKPHRKPSTFKSYQDIWRCHFKNRLSRIRVSDFERTSASRLWEAIARDDLHNGHQLGKRTMSHIRFFLSGVFEYAKDKGRYRGENPAGAALPEGLKTGKPGQAYTMDDLNTMLTVLQRARDKKSVLAQAILAMAFGSGLRKGELQGLRWEDFELQEDGSAKITVNQSVWHGKIGVPKTTGSADVVNLGPDFVAYIEKFRASRQRVNVGFMFGYSKDRPIDLDSFHWWILKPMLTRCAICKRPQKAHGEESVFHPKRVTAHQFKRDESMPSWKGWHAFRRGNASHLAANFGSTKGVEAAARMLRHADEGVTAKHYVQESRQTTRARAAAKQLEIAEQKQQAAIVLGDGLRTARKQARIN